MTALLTDRLLAAAQYWADEEGARPPIDCRDLAAQMQVDASAAYAALRQLDRVQLMLQVVCYAAYARERLGLDTPPTAVLAHWESVLRTPAVGSCCFVLYAIEDVINPGIYIGQTMRLIWCRWEEHRRRLRANYHHCTRLQAAWNADGSGAFIFRVLERYSNAAALDQAEIATIAQLRAEGTNVYNA